MKGNFLKGLDLYFSPDVPIINWETRELYKMLHSNESTGIGNRLSQKRMRPGNFSIGKDTKESFDLQKVSYNFQEYRLQAAIPSELYLSIDIARTTMDAENSISMQNVVLIGESEKRM